MFAFSCTALSILFILAWRKHSFINTWTRISKTQVLNQWLTSLENITKDNENYEQRSTNMILKGSASCFQNIQVKRVKTKATVTRLILNWISSKLLDSHMSSFTNRAIQLKCLDAYINCQWPTPLRKSSVCLNRQFVQQYKCQQHSHTVTGRSRQYNIWRHSSQNVVIQENIYLAPFRHCKRHQMTDKQQSLFAQWKFWFGPNDFFSIVIKSSQSIKQRSPHVKP